MCLCVYNAPPWDFEVLTAVLIKMSFIWNMTPSCLKYRPVYTNVRGDVCPAGCYQHNTALPAEWLTFFFLNFTKCHGQVSYTRGSGFRSHKASGCHDPCFAWLFVSPCSQMSGQFLKLGHVSCFHILSSLVFASRPTLYHYIKISYNFVLIFVLIN